MNDADMKLGNEAKVLMPTPYAERWPSLPYEEWKGTYETLHMWTQIVGKIRLSQSPMINHWWQTALYVTARGLTTTPIPYQGRLFEIVFDFIDHSLVIESSDGRTRYMSLYPRSVADFYKELMATLHELQIEVTINTMPQEVPNPIAFEEDSVHAAYDQEYVTKFWRILVATDSVFKEFRGRFLGKCSPVHFWWGSFDLAVTRFTGKRAPERPGADLVTREAYSHECSSAGFWPGNAAMPRPLFYAYTVPEPTGLGDAKVLPDSTYYDPIMREHFLAYDDVRVAETPGQVLLAFLQSTYEAGADLGGWDRAELEWKPIPKV